jgi:hypothetical protein
MAGAERDGLLSPKSRRLRPDLHDATALSRAGPILKGAVRDEKPPAARGLRQEEDDDEEDAIHAD